MLLLLLASLAPASAAPSQLWGESGELWDPVGRLPDFSYAGYGQGENPLPNVPEKAYVTDFGAVGDGQTDNTAAFQAAIDSVDRGTIVIPAGTYRIDGQLSIQESQLVLRGSGPSKSVLAFTHSMEDLFGPAQQWSWNGGLIDIRPPETPTELTAITSDAVRGDFSVAIADAESLVGKDMVVLHLTDDSTGTLGRHLYAEQADGGDCSWQDPLTLEIPLRIESVREDVVHFTQPFRHDIRSEWTPKFLTYPNIDTVGIESLTIEFPETEYAGHLNEPGYNAIFMQGGVVNSWVKNVTIVNADNGVLTDTYSKWITVDGLTLEGRYGHHGLNIAHTADSLFQNLHYSSEWRHAMTVDHRSNGNVFKNITSDGIELSLDHHRDSPFENLFTNTTAPTNLFNGGSECAGYPGGARNTFWGHQQPLVPPYWKHIQTNLVGPTTVDESLTQDREWIEPLESVWPRDLHKAQLYNRMGWVLEDTGTPGGADTSASDTGASKDRQIPGGNGSGCGCSSTSAPTTALAGWLILLVAGRRSQRR